MLGCALATAYLVFVEGWEALYAGLTVVGSVVVICGILLFILYVLAAPEDKSDFASSSLATLRDDLDGLLRSLHLKH